MPLDPANPITPLQSRTIRAVLGIVVTNVASTLTQLGVSAVSVQEFTTVANTTISIASNLITLYLAWKAYHARVNATETIQKV